MSTTNSLYAPFHDVGFKAHDVKIPSPAHDPTLDLTIHALVFEPESPAQHTLLLLHGHPQSNLIWLRAAPKLVAELKGTTRIIIPDLRGHGKSTAVSVERDEKGQYKDEVARGRYTKREMARDMVELVKAVGGHEKFYILAHDRGARVAHRLSLDYPESVHSLLILDIAPTVDVYLNTDLRFALYYWHWFFLVQPHPIPEQMILGAPQAYIKKMTVMNQKGGVHGGEEEVHPKEILESYTKTLQDPAYVEATCEDYRQSSPLGLDFEHDKESRAKGQKVQAPFRVLWGANGIVENLYGREKQLAFWRGCCERLDEEGSKAVPSGHYIPEELPDTVVESALDFFKLTLK
ncbi:alpha/beta-hydrolase [Jaminaea rosea]|uniref:Alpha/beta-hydrolase n=1 Tax=Jaminaea rosea TaxID=1569628 RepID=A0A316UKX1_9BASI|nr:alpha/beta-hydrolase [Jaminaea rosea]PWN25880.1 alpha/beta-hydrolase [Jaminaea rosea]